MKTGKIWGPAITLLLGLSIAGTANAKVSAAEAEKLGKELTCVGAEAAGNQAGTIPPFSGKWLGTPRGMSYTPHVGQHPIDPYPDDQPIFTITADNMAQYADHLTDGQKALLQKYPQTYRIPVYEGRRDFRYPDSVCDITKKNALETELIDDGMGFTGYKGGIAFPIPKQAMEVFVNMTFPYRAFNEDKIHDIASVNSQGQITWGRQRNRNLTHTNTPEQAGQPMGGMMSGSRTEVILPEREKGIMTLIIEPVNFAQDKRLGWMYDPGTRRVRQLPMYGFDNPLDGTGGRMTVDQDRLMNGSPERYDWALLGKREIYIPANSYRIHADTVKYADLIQKDHANPDYARYELRRVWVLEGTLKSGYRHVYGKRVLFLDEDNWQAAMSDYYDSRGQLWQHALINHYYAFDMQAWQAGTSFYYDLDRGGYLGYGLTQEREKGPVLNRGDMKPSMLTPAALRAAGN